MLSPIATAGSAGVRALVQAADPVEALLDTPDDHLPGGSVHHAVAPAVDTSPFAPPGAQLALLATQMPTGLAVAATTAPPSPAAATSPAPTASPQEIAALELMLADPLHRELLANYTLPPQALGATGLAPDLVARYGADLASRLDQLGRAQAAVRDDFLRALDGAHGSPPSGPPSGPGWVATTVFAVPEDGGPQTVWSFDPDRFAAAYAQGSSLAQRAFAAQCTSLLGHGSAPASTTVAAHESADVATTRVAGHFTLTGGGWSESGSKNGPGQRSWQDHGLVNDGSLAVLDPARPPELHQREAVWFDTALGWVTARENIVVKDGFLDKLAKVSFGVAAAWMVGRLDFLAFGPGTAGQIASQAAVGATTAAVTQLAFTGRLDFGGLLRTALTSGLTAGLAQVPQLQPWLATQTGLGLDPARLLGRAGLQGLLQEATGGRFADGALASVANSMAASVGDTLSQGIDARVQAGELSPAEASAWRLMSQAARSAVSALGHPGDPMAGFAQDYLGGLLAAAEVPAYGDALSSNLVSTPLVQQEAQSAANRSLLNAAEVAADPARYQSYASWPDQTAAESARLGRQSNPYAHWPDQTGAESTRLDRQASAAREAQWIEQNDHILQRRSHDSQVNTRAPAAVTTTADANRRAQERQLDLAAAARISGMTRHTSSRREADPNYRLVAEAQQRARGLPTALPVDQIPGASPGMRAPPTQSHQIGGFLGAVIDRLDDFQRSPLGHNLQALPPEGFIVSGAKAGLIAFGRLGNVENALPALEQGGLTRLATPRTPGLGPTSTTAELLQSGAIPGREGVVLTQRHVGFNDLWQLSENSGVEFVLTRENGQFVLRSGSPTSAPIPGGVRPIVHTHPLDELGANSVLPSRADINVLNDYWARNPTIQRPVSQIITGPNQTTRFRATGLDSWSKP